MQINVLKLLWLSTLALFTLPAICWTAVYDADPSTYRTIVSTLQPGDTLNLSSGNYLNGLSITDRVGTADQPIIITGPESGDAAVFLGNASRNTVSIRRSAYITIKNITIDGQNIANIDAIKAEGDSGNWTHHITIENCTITGHDANQQTVGISTKAPSWDWVIRNNIIHSAGTGLYLGNSNGEAPFIRGTIEYNLVMNPEGYCMEIKHQNPRTALNGMPSDGSVSVIRHNVFIKDDDPSGSGDRPNVLVGHFPVSGTGHGDRYEIYGNFFYHNPREALFQGEGNIHLHDNVFVDSGDGWPAVNIRPHNDVPKDIAIYNNTIYQASRGITVTGADSSYQQSVVGNAVFADSPLNLSTSVTESDNTTDSIENAGNYLVNPTLILGEIDLYPLSGQLSSSSYSHHLERLTTDLQHSVDFNGTTKDFTYRGAYHGGEGRNPGWQVTDALKSMVVNDDDSSSDSGNDDQGGSETVSGTDDSSGGGCFIGLAI